MARLFQSRKLQQVLTEFHKFNETIGVSVLGNDRPTKWVRIKTIWFRASWILYLVFLLMTASTTFSTNDKLSRFINITICLSILEVTILESFVLWKRKDILSVIDWCHKVELQRPAGFETPDDWFMDKRRKTMNFIRLKNLATISGKF